MSVLSAPTPTPSRVSTALASSRLGVLHMIFYVLSAAAPLTVVAGGATAALAITGVIAIPLGYMLVTAILTLFSLSYVAMSQRVPNAGAFYAYVAHGLGKVSGVSAAFVACVAYNVMQVGLYGGFGVALGAVVEAQADFEAPWWAWAAIGWGLIAVLGGVSVDFNARVMGVLMVGEVIVALVFAAVHLAHPGGGEITFAPLLPQNLPTTVVGVTLVTAITGFVGFENTSVLSEEARDPKRTVPVATFAAVGLIGLVYGFCSWALIEGAGPDTVVGRATAEGADLIFNLAGPYLPAFMITLGRLLFVSSLFAALLAFHHIAARYFYALGREGVIFRVFGRTHPKTLAPLAGSLLQTVIGATGIALFAINGWDPFTQMFFWLTVQGGFGVLILMTATSIAIVAFFARRRNGHGVSIWVRVVAPVLSAVILFGIVVSTVANFHLLLGVDAHDPTRWYLPGAYLAAIIGGAIWAVYLKIGKPEVFAGIGLGASRQVTGVSTAMAR